MFVYGEAANTPAAPSTRCWDGEGASAAAAMSVDVGSESLRTKFRSVVLVLKLSLLNTLDTSPLPSAVAQASGEVDDLSGGAGLRRGVVIAAAAVAAVAPVDADRRSAFNARREGETVTKGEDVVSPYIRGIGGGCTDTSRSCEGGAERCSGGGGVA